MCRNIRPLFNFDPPATDGEIRAASLQFVRKISGFNQPSKTNEPSFLAAVDEIAYASAKFLSSLETSARPKDREREAALRKARSVERFRKTERSSLATGQINNER
jgi:hypothetical protein